LPAGAATELTLEAVNTKLPDKIAGRMPVSLDTGSIGLTRAELDATPVVTAPNITRGGGAVDANTQRVTLATDGPGVAALASLDTKTPALVSGASPVTLQVLGAAIPPHNNVLMSNFVGNNAQTVQYRLNTTVVATVTMTYDATGNMLSATRS